MKASVVHIIKTSLDVTETQLILEIFDKIEAVQWLVKNPFRQITLAKKIYFNGKEANGMYSYRTQEMEISTSRSIPDYGKSLNWGKIQTLSMTGRTELEAIWFTGLHELGHHVHKVLLETNKAQFGMTILAVRTNGVSNYSKTAEIEYFAETFAAWVLYRTELALYDQLGYAMIERALKTLALEVKEYDFGN